MRRVILVAGLAGLFLGCGSAMDGDESDLTPSEDLGEVSQALGLWGVTFQQGQVAQLCGPTTNSPCTVLASSYSKTEDATIRAASPSSNNGRDATLKVATVSANNADVALMKWDLRELAAELPANAVLTGAKLTVNVTVANAVDQYKVAQNVVPWVESTVTWSSWRVQKHLVQPQLGALQPAAVGNVTIDLSVKAFGPILKTWLADHNKNHGLWVGRPGATAPATAFRSSEAGVAATAPKLQLWFKTP